MAYINTTTTPAAPALTKFDYFIEAIAAIITTYYTPVLIILGILGNILSVYVFYTSKLRVQSTSLYLSVLAISDTMFLLQLLPPWLNTMQITNLFHRRGFCQLFVYIFYSSCCLSAWLVVAFTIERYVAVLYPLRRNSMCTVTRAKTVIALLTLFSMMINLPVIKYATALDDCNIKLEYIEYAERFNLADTIISFSMPLVIVVVLNVQITWAVWKRSREQRAVQAAQAAFPELGGERPPRALPPLRSQNRVTRMLLIVSTVFVVLNLPAYTMRLLAYTYNMSSGPYSGRWAVMNTLTLSFFNTNFGINFILYCLTGQNFRRELCQSIPWLRNRFRRSDDIPLALRNAGRAGSVTASYVSATDASSCGGTDPVAQRRQRREIRERSERRHRSEPFIEVWTFDNSRAQRVPALPAPAPDLVQNVQPGVQPHAQPAVPEEIEMQELAPAAQGPAPAF